MLNAQNRLLAAFTAASGIFISAVFTAALINSTLSQHIAAIVGTALLLAAGIIGIYIQWSTMMNYHNQLVFLFNTIILNNLGMAHELTPITPSLTPTPTP
jgi:hypothetical protein